MSTPTAAIFGPDEKCVNIALDHGLFNERSFLSGIENMPVVVRSILEAGPDAVQLSPGMARLVRSLDLRSSPALVLRTDIGNVYGHALPRRLFSMLIDEPLEQARRLGAACVVANLLLLTDQPELHEQCLRNVARLRAECDRAGIALMVEPLVMASNAESGGYMIDGDIDRIRPLVRQAAELGADVIKADPTSDITRYREVITVAKPVPVLVRGGGKVTAREVLDRTHAVMTLGAAGVVYGRNVIRHERPDRMVRALMAVVHVGMNVDGAIELAEDR